MSLNIVLTSPHAVYLSGDFRLTFAKDNWKDNFNMQKIISVVRFRWSAMVSFVGLVSLAIPEDSKTAPDVDVWIRQQVEKIPKDGELNDLVQLLLEFENLPIRARYSMYKHAFSIVGFEGRKAFSVVISNYLDVNGNVISRGGALVVTKKKPKSIEVFSAGVNIPNNSRQKLVTLLKQKANPQVIREAMYTTNINTSNEVSTVSQACVTGYILPSGFLEIGPHGTPKDRPYVPDFIIGQLVKEGITGFKVKKDGTGNNLPPMWVGTTARIIYDKRSRSSFTAEAYVIRNVENYIHDSVKRDGQQLFSRTIQEGDSKYYSFKINPNTSSKAH